MKSTIVQIGSVRIEAKQRDFNKPSAKQKLGNRWPLFDDISTSKDNKTKNSAKNKSNNKSNNNNNNDNNDEDTTGYGIMRKIIDGIKINIDLIQMRIFLNGLPQMNPNDKEAKIERERWFGKHNANDKKYMSYVEGAPLIMDIKLKYSQWVQTDAQFNVHDNLNQSRKKQNDYSRDFCVFKRFTSKSLNITLIPHPYRKDKQQNVVFLLKDYPLRVQVCIWMNIYVKI